MPSDVQFNRSAVRAADCVSEGWRIISSNYGLYLGMTFVFLLILFAVNFIPYIGGIVNQFLYGMFICGIYIAILTSERGGQPDFGMLFGGFNYFLQCFVVMLIQLLPSLVIMTVLVPVFLLSGSGNLLDPNSIKPEQIQQMINPQMIIFMVVLYLFVILLTFVLKIFLLFALPLVADRGIGVGEALSLSFKAATGNIGGLVLLVLLEILIVIGGFLMLCIGIIFVLPIIFAAEIAAYRQVFPDNQSRFNNEPPRPDAYGGNYGMPQNFQ